MNQLRTRVCQEKVGKRRASRHRIARQLLTIAGASSLAVAAYQIVISFSPSWSRRFGAPSELVSDPTLLCFAGLAAAVLFGVFSLYALSGAGRVRPLPFLRLGLLAIGCLYFLRGLVIVPLFLVLTGILQPWDGIPEQTMAMASSLVSFSIGVLHLVGVILGWSEMPSAVAAATLPTRPRERAMSLGSKFFKEIRKLDLPTGAGPHPVITETDFSSLPQSAQRYLRFMGVVGRPRDWSFRAGFIGRFKVKESAPWRSCDVWQYNTSPIVTRTFFMKLRLGGIPVIGRDTYREGHGRMLVKVLDLLTFVDGSGSEFDIGELVTYLNDLVLLAPSMLLVPGVTWAEVDGCSFDLSLTDHQNTVKARVFLDDCGAPVSFETTDRFCEDPANPKKWLRARWSTPVEGFHDVGGRQVPTRGQAIWHLDKGDLPYADFDLVPERLAYNISPGE